MLAATARYAAFLLIALVGPGASVQRLLGAAVDPALVLPLGIAFTAGAYWLSLVTGLPWLFPIAVIAVDAVLAWRRGGGRAEGPSLRGAVAPAAALIALLAVTQYPWNRVSAGGGVLLDGSLVPSDTAFHGGPLRAPTPGHPPQVAGAAGVPVPHHHPD